MVDKRDDRVGTNGHKLDAWKGGPSEPPLHFLGFPTGRVPARTPVDTVALTQ